MQKMIEFKSGLKLVFVQNTAVRSVAIGVFVGAGVVKETPENAGISHFIEHMVFKGTTKRSAFDIVNEIDCIGAQINAYTAKSYTCFHTVSLDTNAEKCADVLSDMYFNPAFDPVELEKERRVVIEEINESEDTPDDLCLERLLSLFFKGCPLEKAILGTKKTLKEMTSQTLKDYHDKHYVAKKHRAVYCRQSHRGASNRNRTKVFRGQICRGRALRKRARCPTSCSFARMQA